MKKTKVANVYLKTLRKKFPDASSVKEDRYSVSLSISKGCHKTAYHALVRAAKLLADDYMKQGKLPCIEVYD